jgi:hypothetical protein
VAASVPGWAPALCIAAKAEIDVGELGLAARERVIGPAGLTRMVLIAALDDAKASPSGTAVTALRLIFVRDLLRPLHPLLPAASSDVPDNSLSVPSSLGASAFTCANWNHDIRQPPGNRPGQYGPDAGGCGTARGARTESHASRGTSRAW